MTVARREGREHEVSAPSSGPVVSALPEDVDTLFHAEQPAPTPRSGLSGDRRAAPGSSTESETSAS